MKQSGFSTRELTSYPLVRQCPYRPAAETPRLTDSGPVTRVRRDDGSEAWLVTGPSEARALLADDRATRLAPQPSGGALFGVDPTEHGRQRHILRPSFTIRRAAGYRAEIKQIVDERIDELLEQGPPADFVTTFADPVAIGTVSAFLDIPARDRQPLQPVIADLVDPERADEAVKELTSYLAELVEARQVTGGYGLLNDLVELHPDELALEEVTDLLLAVLVAGTATASSMVALGMLALTEHPEQLAALHDDPGLIPGAIEELLRHLSVVEHVARVATADLELGGVTIKDGDAILIGFAAANLDPGVTAHPQRLDVTRPPVNHLAFGHGDHHCLGRELARLELDIAFRGLIARLPSLRAAIPVGEMPFDDAPVPRLLCFPVTW